MSHLTDEFDNWADRGMARITQNPHPKPPDDPEVLCDICHERIRYDEEMAEMYDPTGEAGNVICHAHCGLGEGLVPA